MNIERDKFLTKARGNCWHAYYPNKVIFAPVSCLKCGEETVNPSMANEKFYDTPTGFFQLWNWAQTQTWWLHFQVKNSFQNPIRVGGLIHPDRFANALYEYLKEEVIGNGCPEWQKCTDRFCPDCGT